MQGIFVGLTEQQILDIRTQAQADIKAGRVITSYTAPSGVQVSKQIVGMSPSDILLECQYALQKLNSTTYGKTAITSRTKAYFP